MSVSALFGTRLAVSPAILSPGPSLRTGGAAPLVPGKTSTGLVIECSSRPQKKATAHHRKTRPRKTQPWDIKRKPTVYAPLPPLPPDWTLASDDGGAVSAAGIAAGIDQAPPPS